MQHILCTKVNSYILSLPQCRHLGEYCRSFSPWTHPKWQDAKETERLTENHVVPGMEVGNVVMVRCQELIQGFVHQQRNLIQRFTLQHLQHSTIFVFFVWFWGTLLFMNFMILESLQIPIDARVIKPGISVGLIFGSRSRSHRIPTIFFKIVGMWIMGRLCNLGDLSFP